MGKQRSIRNKAVHLVSDITTVLFNPISDKPSKHVATHPASFVPKDEIPSQLSEDEKGPDTSSFSAFLVSLLSSSVESKDELEPQKIESESESENLSSGTGRKGLFSRGRQSFGRVFVFAAKLGGLGRNKGSDRKGYRVGELDQNVGGGDGSESIEKRKEDEAQLPEMSDSSLLLSDGLKRFMYVSLPALAKGRKWVLLYSTWSHGISLSTLYRRSMLCEGPSLLVVGDRKGAVFGGLIEVPLRPSKSRKYQGTNGTFVFTDMDGQLRVYHPTGLNRYFTLCSPDFLALGGGNHFALYLDNDLLNGSSGASETYGNSCLAFSPDFAVKGVEVSPSLNLWGFVYASKYKEILDFCREEAPPGICRW